MENISIRTNGKSGVNIILQKDGHSKFRSYVSSGTLGSFLDSLLKGKPLAGIFDIDADREEDVDSIVRLAKEYLYSGNQEIQIVSALQEIRDRMTLQAKQYYGSVFKRVLGLANNNPVQFVHSLNNIVGVGKNKNNNENNMREGGTRRRKRKGRKSLKSLKSHKSNRTSKRKTYHRKNHSN